MFLLLGDCLYWFLIGVPALYISMAINTDMAMDYRALILLKQIINGVLYTSITTAALLLMPASWLHSGFTSALPKLSSRIYHLSVLSAILPALVVAMVITSGIVKRHEQNIIGILGTTISVGAVCVSREFERSFQSLVEQADTLMYQGKDEGKNRVTLIQV